MYKLNANLRNVSDPWKVVSERLQLNPRRSIYQIKSTRGRWLCLRLVRKRNAYSLVHAFSIITIIGLLGEQCLDVVEMEGSYSVCAGSLLFWRAQVRWNESTSVLRKYIYAEIPTKNPAIALQWALDWKETGSIYIIGAACITISMWTCWHMSSKTMDVYPEKNFFWGIYPMCKMRFTNFSGRRPTWEYFGHLVTHWMKWVKKIAWWIVVKIMPIYGQCLEISTFKIVGAKTNNNNNIFSVAYI